jgi:superfamily II DNA or RNA helicase
MSEEIDKLFKNLKTDYDSGEGDDLGKDFFTPCLKNCNLYLRTTSDFTSNVIFEWGEAVIRLVDTENEDCKINMVAHHKLHTNDWNVLRNYLDNKNKIDEYLDKLSENIFEEAFKIAEGNADEKVKLKLFAYLVASGRLELKFAFPHHVKHPNVFHQKYGIFKFPNEKKIGFLGSPNETIGGHSRNIETIEVFNSSISHDLKRIHSWENKFNKSWNDNAKGFRTKSLTKKTLDRIHSYTPGNIKKFIDETRLNKKATVSKSAEHKKVQELWPHRKEAVKIFLEEKSGILEMATGTGKTWTTLDIIGQLLDEKKINKIIIQMKGSDLIDQWIKEIKIWKIDREESIRILKQNSEKKEQEIFEANFDNDNIDILFVSQFFLPQLLKSIENNNLEKTLIIHDEIHNLPTEKTLSKIQGLQKNIAYKLGLSATVHDPYEDERDDRLFEEVGPIIFKFGLKEAIKNGILVELDYQFLDYELTPEERRAKAKWYTWRQKQIDLKRLPMGQIDKTYRIQVSKINKLAINKLRILNEYISSHVDVLDKCFIFVLEIDYGNKILEIVMNYISEVRTYYEEHADRINLKHFAQGDLKCIINCKMLAEGINLKSLSNIILVSSESERQLRQRLGRVLRVDDKNNPNKRALVIDFIDREQKERMDGADYRRHRILTKLSTIKRVN